MDKTLKKTAVACALMMFAFSGLITNGFSAYQPFILSQNGFTNTQGSTILTVRNIGSLLAMLFAGMLYKKVSVRKGVALAGLCGGTGLLLFSVFHSFWGYCFAGLIMGASFGLGGMIPLAVISARGFGDKKTKILSVCAAMTGLSTFGFPFLIVSVTERYGLSAMFRLEGAFELAVTAAVYILMKDGPAENIKEENVQAENRVPSAYTPLSRGETVLFFFIALFAGATGFAGITHLSVLCTGEGLSPQTAAAAVMVSGIALTVSKALYASVKEHIGAHGSQWLYGAMLLSGQLLFLLIAKSTAVLYISVSLFSAGIAFLTVGVADWADVLAPAGKQAGLVQLSQIAYMAGGLAFSSIPGIIADAHGGSYTGAYLVFAALSAAAVLLNLYECKKHRKQEPKA